jgi:exodeoxyribonuclease VII large subunit
MSNILTVSQLNRYIAFTLKEDRKLRGILLRGEISSLTRHTKTGHLFFTLKDSESSVKAVMFSGAAARVGFTPRQGDGVIVSADVRVFERDGVYQLYVDDIQPDGIGALYAAAEQLKQKLLYEGLFDESAKKPLPPYPRRIGVVTSVDGAALRDILNIVGRRCPLTEAVVYPCTVQGDSAPESIAAALEAADRSGLDLIIVGRGGGSAEDLSAFNSERLARCIAAAQTPVISAVGHETDFTISDLTADLRAPTPSAAAELAVPDINALSNGVDVYEKRLKQALTVYLSGKLYIVAAKEKQLSYLFASKRKSAEEKSVLAEEIKKLTEEKEKLAKEEAVRVYKDGAQVLLSETLKIGDEFTVKFSDGEVCAVVIERNGEHEV